MDLLLNSILLGITSSDLFKLNALIEEWNDIKPQREEQRIEEKEEEHGLNVQDSIKKDNENRAMAVWFCQTLKLPQYLDLFESQGFDELEMLSDLTDVLLKELGINKMGHRMKILKAINELHEQSQEIDDDVDQQAEGVPTLVARGNVVDTLR